MALLDKEDTLLLTNIFLASLKAPNGLLDAPRFRADNDQYIRELDKLEQLGYVNRQDKIYSIKPRAIAYLAKHKNINAQTMLQNCSQVFEFLRNNYKNNLLEPIAIQNIIESTGLSRSDIGVALSIIIQAPIIHRHSRDSNTGMISEVTPTDNILRYMSFEDVLKEQEKWGQSRDKEYSVSEEDVYESSGYPFEHEASSLTTSSSAIWVAIENEFGINKNKFGRKINFVKDKHRRTIIFRDVEHSFVLACSGYSKPAVILAGSVIEELLRLYLQHKNIKLQSDKFDDYIKTCEDHKLLEKGISRLTDSARHFRNLVHLSNEKGKKHAISQSMAKGAVSSIFTIANDF